MNQTIGASSTTQTLSKTIMAFLHCFTFSTIPLVLHAEKFEDGKLIDYTNNNEIAVSNLEEEAWAPADGVQRLF